MEPSSRPELPEGFATPGLQVGLLPVKVTSSLLSIYTLMHMETWVKDDAGQGSSITISNVVFWAVSVRLILPNSSSKRPQIRTYGIGSQGKGKKKRHLQGSNLNRPLHPQNSVTHKTFKK